MSQLHAMLAVGEQSAGQRETDPMAARCYCADSENGDHIDAPSEAALFMLIDERHGQHLRRHPTRR